MTYFQFFSHLIFAISLVFIAFYITRYMLFSRKIIDHPNQRSSHSTSVPKSGGISIVITFLFGMGIIYIFGDEQLVRKDYFISFVFCSILIALISLYDDITNKSLKFKFLSQLVAVSLVLIFGIVIDKLSLPGLGDVNLGWIAYVISFIWIFGLTNAYNFMDGLDGLMAGITAIASLFFMIICYSQGSSFVFISCYTLVAGSVGFLLFNFPPAKIFMGDVGSAFIGFTLAVLAIIAARYDTSHTSFLVMPLLLFNVLFDTTFTFFRRLFNGEKVTQAHKTHLYQLMNQLGFSHMEVTLTQYCMVFLQGLGALWMIQIEGSERLYLFIPFILLQSIYCYWVLSATKNKARHEQLV
jgi:UDP-N-acetylmuramyl pentapeptide phosphotransferase/UDP-N-acetylglucosamine-1-phosphate transferase